MVFGTIADDANKSGQSITLFHKKLTDVINDYKSVDNKIGKKKIGAAVNGLFGKTPTISNSDIEALRKYNALLASGETECNASKKALSGVSKQAKQLALDANGAAVSEKAMAQATTTLSTTSKAATLATNALRIGLNMLANVGVVMFINTVVSGITKLINKQEETAEKAAQLKQEQEERRKEAIESSKATKEEVKAIQELTERYIKLTSSTNDITTVKGELSSIQDELIDKYGKEADGIDIVNGKLSENLELLRKKEQEENKQWLVDNAGAIEEAKKFFENNEAVMVNFVVDDAEFKSAYDAIDTRNESEKIVNRLWEELEKSNISDYFETFDKNSTAPHMDDVYLTSNKGIKLAAGLSAEEQIEAIRKFKEIYGNLLNENEIHKISDYFDLSGDRWNQLIKGEETYIDNLKTITDAESRQAQIDAFEFFNTDEGRKIEVEYKKLIDELNRLSQEMNNPENTPAVVYEKQLQLDVVKEEISDLVSEFPILSDEAERAFNNVGLSIDGTIVSTDNLKASFHETYNEMQKGTLANVDKIKKAMKTLNEGGELEYNDAWNILELDDENKIIPHYDENTKKLKIDYADLIALKDRLIEKEKERWSISLETAKQEQKNAQNELAIVDAQIQKQAKGNTKPNNELLAKQSELRKRTKEWGDEILRNELLINELNSSLGDVISSEIKIKLLQKDINDLQKEINDLQSKADDYEKAFNHRIDGVIDSLESEKEILNDELDSLNEQLDVLEKQKDELDEIIDNYKQVADIVSDAIDKEKDLLEEQREAQEKAYNERIDALKEAHDKQEEENELTEKQVALQEKLQALEKAKKNKVMTYSSERGWHYDVDKENLLAAQKDVDDAQKNIDDYLSEKAYEAEIKAIEEERDAVLENYDVQIKAYEDYVEQWKEILEEQTNAENERIAQEILGADWREKIKNKDIQILNNYKSEFRNYNTQLSTLVNGEIANLQESIEIKNEEIKAKQEMIDQWQKYKSEVQSAINDIKNSNESYMQYLNDIALDENSSFETRTAVLADFVNNYSYYIDSIISKSSELESASAQMDALAESAQNVSGALNGFSFDIGECIENMAAMITNSLSNIFSFSSDGSIIGNIGRNIINSSIRPYANGGVNDYTGLAMLHGTKSNPELILNNADAAKLYNMIHNSSFTDTMMEKQYGNLLKSIPVNKSNSSSNTNNSINISHMEVKANDPIQFHEQFQKELKQHYRFALSESWVR